MGRLVLTAALVALAGCGSTATRTITKTAPASSTTGSTGSTSTVTTPSTAPTRPVYFQGAVGAPAVRPATLELTGDGTLSVEHVQWASWGRATATGSGSAIFHGCTPNCAAAPVHTAVVSIRLSNVRVCDGRRYYAGLTLTRSSGRLLDESFVQRPWSPC